MEKGIKGKNITIAIDTVLNNLFSRCKQEVSFNKDYAMTKPTMYNIWIIADKKITKSDAENIMIKLSKKNFIKKSDIEKFTEELLSSYKFRIAILPKTSTDSVIIDMKNLLKSSDVEFVINEFSE